MNPFSSHQTRQTLSYVLFAIVAVVSFVFWVTELRFSIASYDEREKEVVASYQQRQLEHKAEAIRDVVQEIYQTARTISLLPTIREARGGNRRSIREDVVKEGRLPMDRSRMLQNIYANLRAYARVSEIYFVMDGFEPEKGEVPFFMYDNFITHQSPSLASPDDASDVPDEFEQDEYAEIRRQLAWFRENAPVYRYETEINAIPVRVSSLLRTCDNTQYVSRQHGDPRDTAGFVYSVPVYDAQSGRFKGQVSVIVRANVFEAKLLDVPFLPITKAEQEKMTAGGWKMPTTSPFVLAEKNLAFEVSDRRSPLLSKGLVAAKKDSSAAGQWASIRIDLPGGTEWQLHHYLSGPEMATLTSDIRRSKQLSMVGRVLLLLVLAAFLGWGFWLMRTSRRELIQMAHYDLLTNLPNRRLFFERMENGMTRSKRNGNKMGLFFVDLAGLNAINDRYGHHGGDLLLVKMAQRLREHLRETDLICMDPLGKVRPEETGESRGPLKFMLSRLGGDEFTILCEDLHAADDLIVVAERIVDCVKEPFALGGGEVEVTLNVGAALFPDDAEDAERLLMSADSAMHECKNTLARYVLFNEEMRQRAERQHLLTLELKTALQKQQFELFYQPKLRLSDNQVVSMEALIRWRHPTLGLISPLDFIPILERNGAIIEVGEWIVEQACRDLHRLTDAGFQQIRLSLNVSVRQLKHGRFPDFLKATLKVQGIAAERLILEITESLVMEDLKQGRDILLALKGLGVSLAIDDFGAGYSSLTYLQHLPIDYLKIDKSLIDGMVDERSTHVVESVISLAHGLSLKTIAEGIETKEQCAKVNELGCDKIQGYLLSRPLPLAAIIEWLKARPGEPPFSL